MQGTFLTAIFWWNSSRFDLGGTLPQSPVSDRPQRTLTSHLNEAPGSPHPLRTRSIQETRISMAGQARLDRTTRTVSCRSQKRSHSSLALRTSLLLAKPNEGN